MSVSVAVFASGGGSNFQSLLDFRAEDSPLDISLLITDRPGAGALDRARNAGVPARVIPVKGRSIDAVALETLETLEEFRIQVVLLAGYLRLIPPLIVQAFPGRILNIHPALLPAFGGKGMWGHHVHEAVLASGASFSGPTIHFVDEEYDSGSILAQWPVPVLPGDTASTLAGRVLAVEHILYPLAADHLCRAVEKGEPVSRPAFPGEMVFIDETVSMEALGGHIDAAFRAARG
jgi:formyltetrahydrofolate-dependent phosphoribosylglycinamide formyltransferase